MLLFCWCRLNSATVPLANSFGWPPMCWIGGIHPIHSLGGTNSKPWWWYLWGGLCWLMVQFNTYSYIKNLRSKSFCSWWLSCQGAVTLPCPGPSDSDVCEPWGVLPWLYIFANHTFSNERKIFKDKYGDGGHNLKDFFTKGLRIWHLGGSF